MIRSSGIRTVVFSVVMAIGLKVTLKNEVGNNNPSYEILVELLVWIKENLTNKTLRNFANFARHKKTKFSRKVRYERKGFDKQYFANIEWHIQLYIPRIMEGSILSILLIFRAIFKVGSLFPDKYSLTREGETPIFFANARCDIDS